MRMIAILLAGLLVAGCGLPRDQRGTLDTVRGSTLTAALAGPESIRESELLHLEAFAQSVGARLEIRDVDLHEAMDALEHTEIQIVAGLPKSSPFRHVARSRTYRAADGEIRVWAVPPGENALLIEVNRQLGRETQ